MEDKEGKNFWTFREEGSQWNGYKMWATNITRTGMHNDFFCEYKMARTAMDYTLRNVTRQNELFTKAKYVEYILQLAPTSMFGRTQPPATPKAIQNLSNSIYDASQGQKSEVKEQKFRLQEQANILVYLGEGDYNPKYWNHIERKGEIYEDQFFFFRFGKEKHLPMLWFLVSMNEKGKYLRLHSWARSVLTPYLLTLYTENETVPPRIGAFALAWLIHLTRFKRQRLYGQFLTGSVKVLKKMDPSVDIKAVPEELKDEAGKEPEYVEMTQKLTHAHLEPFIQNYDEAIDLIDAPLPVFPRDVWIDIIAKYEIFSVSDIERMCRVNRDFANLCKDGLIWRHILFYETIPTQPIREILQRVFPNDYKMQVIVNRIYKLPLTDESKETRGWKFKSGDRIMLMLKYVRGLAAKEVEQHLYPAQSVQIVRISNTLVAFTQALEEASERIEAVMRFIRWKLESGDEFDRCQQALCNNHLCGNQAKYTCGGPQFKYCSEACARQDYAFLY